MKISPSPDAVEGFRTRFAAAADIPGLRDVEVLSQPSPWSDVVFQRELEVPHSSFWVVNESDRIAGFLVFWVVYDEVHILNLAVHPDFRRRGVANSLLAALMKEAQENDMTSVTLEVRASNAAAQALYAGFGFDQIGRRKGYYADNSEDAFVLAAIIEERQKI
jgi:ribosomal-protein-alanine N-acetyltransferase